MVIGENIFGKHEFLKTNQQLLQCFHNIDDTLVGVILNVVDYCNLKCTYCPVGNNYITPLAEKKLSLQLVDKIAADLGKNFSGYVSLSGFGEPTLHPHLQQIISIFANECPHANILLLTNAVLVSALENLEYSERLYIYCSEHKAFDRATLTALDTIKNKVIIRRNAFNRDFFNNRAQNSQCTSMTPGHNACCNMPFYKTFIDMTGNVLLCHSDWQRTTVMGNAYDESIYAIWKNDKYAVIRKNLISNMRHCNQLCAKCDIHGRLEGSEFVNEWIRYYGK